MKGKLLRWFFALVNALESEMGWYVGLECVSAELACFLRWVIIGLGPFLERFSENGRREREVVTVGFSAHKCIGK